MLTLAVGDGNLQYDTPQLAQSLGLGGLGVRRR